MKERIVIEEDFWVKHFQEREIEFQEEEMCSGGNPEEWWHYKKEQVPETWEELKELCKEYPTKMSKLFYKLERTKVDEMYDGTPKIVFFENGIQIIKPSLNMYFDRIGCITINVTPFVENRTPAQMWQIIKNLIGEE